MDRATREDHALDRAVTSLGIVISYGVMWAWIALGLSPVALFVAAVAIALFRLGQFWYVTR